MSAEDVTRSIKGLISSYHELNATYIEAYTEEPSPLDFMRHVARNRPFVVRKSAQGWPAMEKWNSGYLKKVMESQMVNVAMTPFGNADSVLEMQDGSSVFVKPHEADLDFGEVLDRISEQELEGDAAGPVYYAQTQNDNLRNEYASLFRDVPKSIPFARIALQREPDAVNFWLGNSKSTTALHKDPYENMYVQVLGQKHFVLLPPVEAPCINETLHPAATYRPRPTELELSAVLDEPPARVPFAVWDPDVPEKNTTAFSHLSRPMRVTLNPGDMLYLPALWYHKVSQSCSDEGICCAVNYWYDMEYTGSLYPLSMFIREVGLIGCQSDAAAEYEVGNDND